MRDDGGHSSESASGAREVIAINPGVDQCNIKGWFMQIGKIVNSSVLAWF